MAFSDAQIQDLRERADLVSLIGARVALKKRGRDHVGLCPFHGERSPSFNVIPHKGMYHCFGCGESGDVFKFFMKLDGLGFIDALKLVATQSGIILQEENADPEADKRRKHLDDLAALLDRATKFYESKLWHAHGKPALDHLKDRGIEEAWIKRFRLGFGGHGREDLALALEKAGVDFQMAEEAGLCIPSKRGGRPFDRFAGRLIVPIAVPRPPNGRVVGLGGRWLDGVLPPPPDRKPAKYINSPETPLYSKGSILFGLDVARDAIRKEEKAVIVEGYFDVIGTHQVGLPLAVATCGTSLTPAHLELLTRTGAKEILFLFDGDAAGIRAAERAAELCAKGSVPARVATLPDNLDPDEYAKKFGVDALRKLLDGARPAIELLIDVALSDVGSGASVEERVKAVEAVRGVILSAPEGLARTLYVQQVADRLRVPESAVRDIVEKAAPAAPARSHGHASERPAPRPPVDVDPLAPIESESLARAPEERRFGKNSGKFEKGAGRFERRPPREPGQWDASRRDAPPPREYESRPREAPAAVDPMAALTRVAAQRQLSTELAITLQLLNEPTLASTVAQEGALADFLHPQLRELCERAIAAFGEHEPVEVPSLVRSIVREPELQKRILKEFALAQEGLADDAVQRLTEAAVHLSKGIDLLRRERNKRAVRELALQQSKGLLPSDEASQRVVLEEQTRRLEASRALDKRKKERGEPP